MMADGRGQTAAEPEPHTAPRFRHLRSAVRHPVLILWAWLLFLTLTHLNAKSPYSYGWALFNEASLHFRGAVVNPDAADLELVFLFFYEAHPQWWERAQNLSLPTHAFATSIVAGFVRSYLAANYIANVLFAALCALAAVNLADRFAIRRSATLIALLTFFTLPIYVEYLGQPLHYVVGPAGSFLIVLAVMAMSPDDARKPWIAGLATGLMALNYDPYIFLAALVAYFLFVSRFAKAWHYAAYLVIAALPRVAWHQFLRVHSDGTMTKHLRRTFIDPVVDGWKEFFLHPLDNILLPFVASHVGMDVALHQVIVLVHWPLLAVCIYLLIRLRPELRAVKSLYLVALLPLFFLLEQFVAAGFDWEQNPRRAIPVAFAFGVAYVWAAHRVWHLKWWRVALLALLVLNGTLAVSDTLFNSPVMAYIHTSQAIRGAPSEPMRFQKMRLTKESLPKLQDDQQPVIWNDLGRARVARDRRGLFAGTQLYQLALLAGLFWLCARTRILPRWSPIAAGVIWLVSVVARFR
jgi:hypothetical protein